MRRVPDAAAGGYGEIEYLIALALETQRTDAS
jgi:hypothetical protein